jgi:uncharacterized protein (TIGR00369 family)
MSIAHLASRVRQPNSRHCFVCGMENAIGLKLVFYEDGPDSVVSHVELDDRYQGYPGIVHGGISAAMLDEAVGRAAMIGRHTHFMLTARIEVRYRHPVPVGERLRLTGKLISLRGRVAKAHSELQLPNGILAAQAEATLVDLPDENMDETQLRTLGWQVYADGDLDTKDS